MVAKGIVFVITTYLLSTTMVRRFVMTESAATADITPSNITTTSRIDNYILQNQRQYQSNTKTMATALEEFKKNYDDRLELLSLNRQFLEFKLEETEQKLIPLELLDDIHNYCVHRYRSKLPDIQSINSSLDRCSQKGKDVYSSIVEDPFFTLNKLENYYRNETIAALEYCKLTYELMHKNYTFCVTTVIQQSNEISSVNLNMFYNQMKQSECTAVLKMKNTFDCYTFVIFNTIKSVGEVNGLIRSCTSGNEFCSTCVDDAFITADRCPYHMSMSLTDDFRSNEKVSNPFKGLASGTPCLQINFINSKNNSKSNTSKL